MPVSLVQRGPFSYDELTVAANQAGASPSAPRDFTLTNSIFDSTIGEVLEVFVNGVKLVGSGLNATGDEFTVDSNVSKITIETDSNLASATNSTVTTLAEGDTVLIRRVSNRTAKKVDFAPGSVIREADLDNANTQVFHVAQEAIDTALQGMVVDTDGKWNASSGGANRVIKNVADGSATNDAVNYGQFSSHDTTILGYQNNALSHKNDANDSKLEANDWATKSSNFVNTYTGAVEQSDGTDYSSKEYAIGTTATSSKSWAVTPKNTQVPGGASTDRSALHYSEIASDHAGTATGAASTATTNATKSGRHEDNAEAYAQTNAETLVTYTDPTTGSTSNDGYSAKHHREKAQEWASSSSNITDDTGTAISPAVKSAKTYAEDAQTAFTNIGNAESNCSTSESNAASSATASEDSKLTSTSYATATGAEVQHYSNGTGTSQTGVYSAKEHATGTTVTTGSAKDWASKAGSAQVASTDYSAKAWAQNTANDIGSAKDWATKAGNQTVANTDYSSKAYAHDTANNIGSSRDWASKLSVQVANTDYSAREYAIGTTATSAKSYATKDDGVVTGTDYSAKAWAMSTDSNAPTDGSAKGWATNAGSAEVATGEGYSSKAYAQDDAYDIGSSKDWAVKTSGQVASSDYSSKEYAVGTQRRGQANGGSAKDWATYTAGTVDNAEYSAKYYKNATQTLHDSFFGVYHGAVSSAPGTHQEGDLYFNTSTNILYYSDGTNWNAISSLPQDLGTSDSPSFTNLTVSGNLQVQGTTTTVDAETTVSKTLTLNNDQASQTDIALDVNSTSTGDAINVSQNSTGKAVVINQVDTTSGGNIIELQSNGTAKVSVDKEGNTTFVGAVTVPAPTAGGHATTKTYVDAVDTLIDNHIADTSNPHSVTKTDVGLGNVTNESKATMFDNPTFTGTVSGVTATHVGLGSASNHASVADTGGTFTGNVKIGSAGAPTQTLDVDGAILASGNITAFSDKRHKENIETIDNALEKVGNMRGVYFTFSKDHFTGVDPTKRQVGVIAQEMQEVLPEGVEYNKDKDTYGVNYGNLVGVLIEAVKELKEKVKQLETK